MSDPLSKNVEKVQEKPKPSSQPVRGQVSVTLSSTFWVVLIAFLMLPAHDTDKFALQRISISTGLIVLVVLSELVLRVRNGRR